LDRPFLSDRCFFITVRLLGRRTKLTEPDFSLLARAFNRARVSHPLLDGLGFPSRPLACYLRTDRSGNDFFRSKNANLTDCTHRSTALLARPDQEVTMLRHQ
jgi:hypothetical protein